MFVSVDGKRYLVGIGSYISGLAPGLNSKYGSLNGAANLNFFHSWIHDNTGIAAVPEPDEFWIGCLGSLRAWRRR